MSSLLNALGEITSVSRAYYGNGVLKPNAHCYMVTDTLVPGWYETDNHFRARIKAGVAAKTDKYIRG